MKFSSWKSRVARAGMLSGLLLAAACAVIAVIDLPEGTFKVEAYFGQLPPGAEPLPFDAEVVIPPYGKLKVKTYDTNGDGKADVAGPVPPNNRYYKGQFTPKMLLVTGPGAAHEFGVDAQLRPFVFVPYENEPASPMPVTFHKGVAEYLADYGIDQLVRGDNVASNIELLAAAEDLTLASGILLDVRLHWNTEAGWVDIEQFPSLQYEFYGLAETPNTWPGYMVARVRGDGAAVLNWLAHHGFHELNLYGLDITGGPLGSVHVNHLAIAISKAAGLAQVSIDGATTYVPLTW